MYTTPSGKFDGRTWEVLLSVTGPQDLEDLHGLVPDHASRWFRVKGVIAANGDIALQSKACRSRPVLDPATLIAFRQHISVVTFHFFGESIPTQLTGHALAPLLKARVQFFIVEHPPQCFD